MLNFNKLTPQCLRHNKNWVYFFKTVNVVWTDNVAKHIPNLSVASSMDLDSATREDILLRASRFGWTFADNFSANWEDDERAERFLKRFIESWIPYCRSYAGTLSFASYMGYLLGMEIRIVQLWSNAHDHWDTKPMHKLFRLEETQLPDDYLVTGNADYPFNPDLEFDATFPLRSRSDLDNQVAGWKTVDQDPENGWYPTSHFDVYVDLVQVPTSDLQEKTAEDIITSLFYELADMNQVLRAIVYSYSFNQVVKVSSALAIKERLQAIDYGAPLEPEPPEPTTPLNIHKETISNTYSPNNSAYVILSVYGSNEYEAIVRVHHAASGYPDGDFDGLVSEALRSLLQGNLAWEFESLIQVDYSINSSDPSKLDIQITNKVARDLTVVIEFQTETTLVGNVQASLGSASVTEYPQSVMLLRSDANSSEVTLGLVKGTHRIDWGDGTIDMYANSTVSHVYDTPSEYPIVVLKDSNEGGNQGNNTMVVSGAYGIGEVVQWWYQGYEYIRFVAAGVPQDTLVKVPASAPKIFALEQGGDSPLLSGCSEFNDPNILSWYTGDWNSFAQFFEGCSKFNQPIGQYWDFSSASTITMMMYDCREYNQPWTRFNSSNLVDAINALSHLFSGCYNLDQDFTKWCVPNVPTAPVNFYWDTNMKTDKLPIWGTCPAP